MTRITLMAIPALFVLILAACAEKEAGARRYPMHGDIKALNASAQTAMIAAGKIDDWMEPMTMEYLIKPDSEFRKLHVGDTIDATVVVKDMSYYVTDIKVAPR